MVRPGKSLFPGDIWQGPEIVLAVTLGVLLPSTSEKGPGHGPSSHSTQDNPDPDVRVPKLHLQEPRVSSSFRESTQDLQVQPTVAQMPGWDILKLECPLGK